MRGFKWFRDLSFMERVWVMLFACLTPMLNVSFSPLMASNEEPKWLVLVICGIFLILSFSLWFWRKALETVPIRSNIVHLAMALFFLLMGAGVFITPSLDDGLIRFSFWIACLCVWLVGAYVMSREVKNHRVLSIFLTAGSTIFSLYYWWIYIRQYGEPGYNLLANFSPVGHVSFTGDVLIMLIPAMLWTMTSANFLALRLVSWFACTSMMTVLLIGASRGALGGMAVASIILVFISLLLLLTKRINIGLITCNTSSCLLLLSTFLASATLYQILPYHVREIDRFSNSAAAVTDIGDTSVTLDEYLLQPPLASFWNRLRPVLGWRSTIYASSTGMLMDAPWLGHGTGSFVAIYPAYANKYPQFRDPMNSMRTFMTNPHNVVLQIASQNGLVAAFLFLFLLLCFWFKLIRTFWKTTDPWIAAGVFAVSAVIFSAMFNHVFFNPASMFVFSLLGGCWWGRISRYSSRGPNIYVSIPWSRHATVLLTIVCLSLFVWPLRWLVSEYYIGQGLQQLHQRQYAQGEASIDTAYVWDHHNKYALHYKGDFAYRQGRYPESIRYLRRLRELRPHDAYDLNLLAANYIRTRQFTLAEEVLLHTLSIQPDFPLARRNLQVVQRELHLRRGKSE